MRFFIYTEIYKKLDDYPLFFKSVASSGVAGFISSYINNPLDVIQTRKQLPIKGNDTIASIISREGIYVLYKGSFVRGIRTIPGAMISFLSYELLCKNIFKS